MRHQAGGEGEGIKKVAWKGHFFCVGHNGLVMCRWWIFRSVHCRTAQSECGAKPPDARQSASEQDVC